MLKERAIRLVDAKRNRVLADDVETPRTFLGRGLGLSFRGSLPEGRAMWINPCTGIHMLFMRFPLDVVFLDRQHTVVKVSRGVRPWLGLIPYVAGAKSVVELPGGTLGATDLERGDRLEFQSAAA